MFGAKHFIYYINKSIAIKVDSTYLSYKLTAHNVYVFDDPWAQTSDDEITVSNDYPILSHKQITIQTL